MEYPQKLLARFVDSVECLKLMHWVHAESAWTGCAVGYGDDILHHEELSRQETACLKGHAGIHVSAHLVQVVPLKVELFDHA